MSQARRPAPSIRELDPIESGGRAARTGFLFQDHVAARFLLEMTLSSGIEEVWCESLDDITLIRGEAGNESVEYVQVKAENLEQLWTIAMLVKRNRTSSNTSGIGSSVLERSLAYDRSGEPSRFRLVLRRPAAADLRILIPELGATEHRPDPEEYQKHKTNVLDKIPFALSPLGHCACWWLQRASYEIVHSAKSLEQENLHLISKIVEKMDATLYADQRESLYELLLTRIQRASTHSSPRQRQEGRILRESQISWMEDAVRKMESRGSSANGKRLEKKMSAANLPSETIQSAQELRRSYRTQTLRPRYLELNKARAWEDRVRARLNRLRASLDSGEISDSGLEFHQRCLVELDAIESRSESEPRPEDFFLQGCMYYITDLCQHRFQRADP